MPRCSCCYEDYGLYSRKVSGLCDNCRQRKLLPEQPLECFTCHKKFPTIKEADMHMKEMNFDITGQIHGYSYQRIYHPEKD